MQLLLPYFTHVVLNCRPVVICLASLVTYLPVTKGIVSVSWHVLLPSQPRGLFVPPQGLFTCLFYDVLFAYHCMRPCCSLRTDHLPALCVHVRVHIDMGTLQHCHSEAALSRLCCNAAAPYATVLLLCHCSTALLLLCSVLLSCGIASVVPFGYYRSFGKFCAYQSIANFASVLWARKTKIAYVGKPIDYRLCN